MGEKHELPPICHFALEPCGKRKDSPEPCGSEESRCGDAGNRTRVRQSTPSSSPGAVCFTFLGPWHHADKLPNRLSQLSVGFHPLTKRNPSGSLNDARFQAESKTWADGLKGPAAQLGGEDEVSALLFGTYWFARIVYEVSAHPRPASARSLTTVETDHPLCSFYHPISGCIHCMFTQLPRQWPYCVSLATIVNASDGEGNGSLPAWPHVDPVPL